MTIRERAGEGGPDPPPLSYLCKPGWEGPLLPRGVEPEQGISTLSNSPSDRPPRDASFQTRPQSLLDISNLYPILRIFHPLRNCQGILYDELSFLSFEQLVSFERPVVDPGLLPTKVSVEICTHPKLKCDLFLNPKRPFKNFKEPFFVSPPVIFPIVLYFDQCKQSISSSTEKTMPFVFCDMMFCDHAFWFFLCAYLWRVFFFSSSILPTVSKSTEKSFKLLLNQILLTPKGSRKSQSKFPEHNDQGLSPDAIDSRHPVSTSSTNQVGPFQRSSLLLRVPPCAKRGYPSPPLCKHPPMRNHREGLLRLKCLVTFCPFSCHFSRLRRHPWGVLRAMTCHQRGAC